MFDVAEVNSAQYVGILKGVGFKYEVNENTHLYQKQTIDINNVSMIDFSHVRVNPLDIIIGSEFVTDDKNSTSRFGRSSSEDPNLEEIPFHVSYRTPDETCITRNSAYEPNVMRRQDLIFLENLFLKPGIHSNLEMKLMVHYPGQLLRNYENPRYSSTFDSHNKEQILELKVSHVTTLIKRPDSNVKCDDTIQNDDTKFQEEVVKRIGCIPIYWKDLIPDLNKLEVCHSSQQLKDAAFLIANFKSVLASYDPPCVDMSTLVIVNKDLPQEKDQFQIMIRYTEDVYQKIENGKDVSFETFFSGVGGFVGIFCGYSIMQIPELFENIRTYVDSESIQETWSKYNY